MYAPLWMLAVLLCVLPALRGIGSVRGRAAGARQHAVEQCRLCRYDLTGNVSGVCPECGTKVPVPTGPPPTPGAMATP